MTANQRRSGFRLPWASDPDESAARAPEAAQPTVQPAADAAETSTAELTAGEPSGGAPSTEPSAVPAPSTSSESETRADASAVPAAASGGDDPAPEFMHELVSAMRRVATETRDASVAAARTVAEERVKQLDADAERRRTELRQRADADIAAIGEWATAEAERIRREAEQRVASRRTELEQQLETEAARGDADAQAVRNRIAEYERELEAFSAQLNEITDPAAFAAAAKRMPRPPILGEDAPSAAARAEGAAATAEPTSTSSDVPTLATNGTAPSSVDVHPAEEEVLAARLAELDATLPSHAATSNEPITTEIVVKGLGSFGAITSFRQALAAVDGIDAVALRLGETGEFIFRTTHGPAFDLPAAISNLEGDTAQVERRGERSLLVTLQRGR